MLVEMMVMYLLLYGNVYVQVLVDVDGSLCELFVLRFEWVMVEVDVCGWLVVFFYKVGMVVMWLVVEDV